MQRHEGGDGGGQAPANSTFSPSDWAVLTSLWHPVAYSKDVQDTPYATRLLDVDLVAYRADGSVVVARDLCIHRGTPLTLGHLEDGESCAATTAGTTGRTAGAPSFLPGSRGTRSRPRPG